MILKRTFVMLVALFGLTFSAVTLSGGDSYSRTSDLQRGLTFAQIAPLLVPAPKSAPDQLPTGGKPVLPDQAPATDKQSVPEQIPLTTGKKIEIPFDQGKPKIAPPRQEGLTPIGQSSPSERSGVIPYVQNFQAIGEAAAVALMLVIIVCYAVFLHVRQKRENEKNQDKKPRR